MTIDYLGESEKYRPVIIRSLLVGEAPPPSGNRYFYVPRPLSIITPIEKNASLPATIFHHYFRARPQTTAEYISLLKRLQDMGIFLIDICDKPIKVRGCHEGEQHIIGEIPKLRRKLSERGISIEEGNIIFLLARKSYVKHLKNEFPESWHVTWKAFRMSPE